MTADVTLTLAPPDAAPSRSDPLLSLSGVSLEAEVHNAGARPVEVVLPDSWDSDLPDELSHSNLSRGLIWVRRVGEPEPAGQGYCCSEGEGPDPEPIRLDPGARRAFRVSDCALAQLGPGDYELEVRLYTPAVTSNRVRLRVEP